MQQFCTCRSFMHYKFLQCQVCNCWFSKFFIFPSSAISISSLWIFWTADVAKFLFFSNIIFIFSVALADPFLSFCPPLVQLSVYIPVLLLGRRLGLSKVAKRPTRVTALGSID